MQGGEGVGEGERERERGERGKRGEVMEGREKGVEGDR